MATVTSALVLLPVCKMRSTVKTWKNKLCALSGKKYSFLFSVCQSFSVEAPHIACLA